MTTFKCTTGFLALAACIVAVGCGSDDEGAGIPRASAAALQNQLDSIQNRFEAGGGACGDITGGEDPNTQVVQQTIDDLPSDVDQDVRDALQQGFDHLFQLVDEQCKPAETQTETQTVTEPPPPPETQTETTPPETTETVPPPTETTEPPATNTEEQVPPDQGGNSPDGEGGNGDNGQGGDAGAIQGGSGGGALVPGDGG